MRYPSLLWSTYRPYITASVLALIVLSLLVAHDTRRAYLNRTGDDLAARAAAYSLLLDQQPAADYQHLTALLAAASTTRYTLIDADGKVLADSAHVPGSLDSHVTRPEIVGALAGEPTRALRTSLSDKQLTLYVALPHHRGVVRAAVAVQTVAQSLAPNLRRLLVAILVASLLGAIAAYGALHGLTRSLGQMRADARRLEAGELDVRLASPPAAELADLAGAINAMASQLGDRLASIQRASGQFEAVLESMAEGVVAIDRDSVVTIINPAATELFATEEAQSLGRSVHEVVRNREIQRFVELVLSSQEPLEAEIMWFVGGERVLLTRGSLLRDHDGNELGALIVFHDMTQLRRLENVRREFVANVSHELRTPIASIIGAAETLLSGALDDPHDARRFVEVTARHSDRLERIIVDLLSLSRLDSVGETTGLDLVEGRLHDVANAAVEQVRPRAEARAVRLELDCATELKGRINAPLLEQALVNLLDNAVTYSQPGQTVRLTVEADPTTDDVVLQVTDTGCGIPAEHLPRIFERFYRVDKARSRAAGGTGLGLAIAKHIANVHGGSIDVTSRLGRGSVFTIHLPTDPNGDPAPNGS